MINRARKMMTGGRK